MLQIKTLGELRQTTDDGTTRPLRRKPLALVAYLARRAPRPASRTELATLFWGERGEERARQSLRQALLELKQVLGDTAEVDVDTVRLPANAVDLDIIAFEQDVSAGRLAEAAARWTGDFFDGAEDIGGDGFRRWIENERIGLHRQLSVAMERLIGDAELRGDWVGAVGWAQRWATALPFDEQAHLRLIEALRMTGQSNEALQTHAAFVSRVRTALDVEPSAEFLRLGGGLADQARSELVHRGRGSAAVQAPALVGRGAVLGELVDAWRETAAGGPVVVLVRGEAGSGLTRICDEMAERGAADGVVLRGRGDGTKVEFATAATLFDELSRAPGTAGASPDALAEVARIVPSLRSRFSHLGPGSTDDGALRDALAQTLAAIAEEKPVLLIVDDVHAADERTRRLLGSLAPRLPPRVMLMVTDDEGETQYGAGQADWLGSRDLRRLQLGEFSIADVDAMLRSMLTMDPTDRRTLATDLRRDSGGLPSTVRELVTALVDNHLLQLDPAGTWRLSPALTGRPLPVPPSVRDRIRTRLERLSPNARALVEAVAVLGDPTDLAIAAEVAELPIDDAESAMSELTARRILRDGGDSPGRFTFAAPVIGRAVAGLLPPTRRQSLHGQAAKVLAERDLATTSERSLLPYHIARAATQKSQSRPTGGAARQLRNWIGAAAGFALLATAAWVWRPGRGSETTAASRSVPVVALGRITDYRENPSHDLAKPLTDMLATNLGRVEHLRVVSTARMYELVNQGDPGAVDTSAAALVAAARRAGATELVDGALYAREDGGFRLDVRRVDLGSGNILQTHSVTGATIFQLADSGTARLAADFGEATPRGSIADVTTGSVTAYRLYEQGLRAYYSNDLRGAEPLFQAALIEDSSFAMAAFYHALSSPEAEHSIPRYLRAARLAGRASDRERMIILARLAFQSSSPALRSLADTLMVRYPDEVEGYFYAGLSRMVEGDFLVAVPLLERAVDMDSLALRGDRPRCVACDAFRQIISAYQQADSLPAAERVARHWARLQPRSSTPVHYLADVLAQMGRASEATAALDQEAAIDAGRREGLRLLVRGVYAIYAGDFDQADRLLSAEIQTGSPERIKDGLWFRVISRRYQGRLEEAFADAKLHRASAPPPTAIMKARRAVHRDAIAEAQVLFEMGKFRAAAALFDSIGRWTVAGGFPTEDAHFQAWMMTHGSVALAAAGDTATLAARADSIERLGAESGSGRDRRLHRQVRGMLAAARGHDEAAIVEYRAAIYSPNFGYTRTNITLAEALLRLHRPTEAIPVLQSALRGNLEASTYYADRTDLHARLADAWDAVGGATARDSALAHHRYVLKAWSRSDPGLAARVEHARLRVAALEAAR